MNQYTGQLHINGGWVSLSVLAPDIYEANAYIKSLPDVRGTCVSKTLTPEDHSELRAHVAHVGRDHMPAWMFFKSEV